MGSLVEDGSGFGERPCVGISCAIVVRCVIGTIDPNRDTLSVYRQAWSVICFANHESTSSSLKGEPQTLENESWYLASVSYIIAVTFMCKPRHMWCTSCFVDSCTAGSMPGSGLAMLPFRSEERRVGKEGVRQCK